MEYYAGYKIKEVVALREHMRAIRKSDEMHAIEKHWMVITKQDQHQTVVKHQGELVMAAAKALHLFDEPMIDPAHSPAMFDAWHLVHLYFTAMMKGDLEPIFDFMIDGKYDDEFVHEVDPKFPAPENYPHDLYLY
jgi:hypothetical protein